MIFKPKRLAQNWERWFAWYPVYCLQDEATVWLSFVERREYFVRGCYEYRLVRKESKPINPDSNE